MAARLTVTTSADDTRSKAGNEGRGGEGGGEGGGVKLVGSRCHSYQ